MRRLESLVLCQSNKKGTKFSDELLVIIKITIMIENHIHIRIKRYCTDKEINILDYT